MTASFPEDGLSGSERRDLLGLFAIMRVAILVWNAGSKIPVSRAKYFGFSRLNSPLSLNAFRAEALQNPSNQE